MWDSDVDFDLAAFHAPCPTVLTALQGFEMGERGGSDWFGVLGFPLQGAHQI